MQQATKDFLSKKVIAVVGVSRRQNMAANYIYKKLRKEGYKVYAVNPNTSHIEGDNCYPNLKSIPEKPGGVMIVTKPEVTEDIVKECAALGIKNVWMHKGMDPKTASVSTEAIHFCHDHKIDIIPGGCPMMYCRHADLGHRFMRWIQNLAGKLPKSI